MRIALIVRRMTSQGGTERFVLGLSRALVGLGHEVQVFCNGADEIPAGVEIRPVGAGGRGRIGRMIAMQRAVRRIDPGPFDRMVGFVRVPGMDVFRAGGGAHAAWMAARGWSLADAVERHLDRGALQSAGLVVVNSEMGRGDVLRHSTVSPDRLRLVRNGVDLERFRPAPAGSYQDGRRVVFLGAGFARKGLDVAIAAVARLPGINLLVLGADRHAKRFVALARRLGVADRVRFEGTVPSPELMLPTASAMILPTRYDPFANACLEALACGVPVITSRKNGAAEICPFPWMCVDDPEDVAGFSLALAQALETPGIREASRASAERLPHSFAFARMAAVIEEPRR